MVLNRLRFVCIVVVAAVSVSFPCAPSIMAQCTGLHAGITAQLVPLKAGYSAPEHVLLAFLIVNDSDSKRNVAAGSWKLIINGTELPDTGMLFGNGPRPVGGYSELGPGENYQFGIELPVSDYFKVAGEYRISWKAEGFESSTVSVRIPSE
jgi:hypothetical protein